MRAVVVDSVRAHPRVREVPEPTAPSGGVVLRVTATGVCRSDWHAWAGHDEVAFPQCRRMSSPGRWSRSVPAYPAGAPATG